MRPGHSWHIGWRWIALVTGVIVLCSLPVLAGAVPVTTPSLTTRQLEDRVLAAQRLSYSGYAESDATFGLPSLPAFSTVTPLVDGITRMRVWQATPDHWRVDTLSDTGEDDTYQAGNNTFTWDSGEQLLTGIYGAQHIRLPRAADLTPPALAVRMINGAGPGAKLSLLPARRVAGQSAAGLAIKLDNPQSTIAQADIWASPSTGLPLLVEVFGRDSARPTLETQFLQAGLWTPDRAVLTPQHSAGTGFTTTTPDDFAGVLQNLDNEVLPARLAGFPRQPSPVSQVGVYGTGLTTFAVLTFRPHSGGDGLLYDALRAGATKVTFPDHGIEAVASAPLLSLVLVHSHTTHLTFLLVGLVNRASLQQAAAILFAQPDQER